MTSPRTGGLLPCSHAAGLCCCAHTLHVSVKLVSVGETYQLLPARSNAIATVKGRHSALLTKAGTLHYSPRCMVLRRCWSGPLQSAAVASAHICRS